MQQLLDVSISIQRITIFSMSKPIFQGQQKMELVLNSSPLADEECFHS